MPEVTFDTSDPKLRGVIASSINLSVKQGDSVAAVAERVVGAIVEHVSPEPPEPPPGVYRDAEGRFWHRIAGGTPGSYRWITTGSTEWRPWEEIARYAPLTRLFSVDEVIPKEPVRGRVVADHGAAEMDQLCREAGFTSPADRQLVGVVCRVLRERAESLGPRGTEGSNRG